MSAPSTARRLHPGLIAIGAVALVAGLAFAWWTISPLFISSRVDEAFPTAAPAAAQAAPTAEAMMMDDEATGAGAADQMAETAAPAAVVEAAPTAAPAAVAPTAAPASTEAPAAVAPTEAPAAVAPTEAPAAVAPTAAPAEPVALASGSFTRIDALHAASGTATIYRLPDGAHVLRLENFDAQNGPDLRVGLSGHPEPRSNGQLTGDGYVELAVLKANQGNQNYELPADLDPAAFRSVVIYCKAFSVVFSTAALGG
jgi:pyruvate/2-oxoglutarate dehydrogenase complex dihydrolipoamide acyltransferase (E2) component